MVGQMGELKKYLQEAGYQFIDSGGSKDELRAYLSERYSSYQPPQQSANSSNSRGTSYGAGQNVNAGRQAAGSGSEFGYQYAPQTSGSSSRGLSFWDVILLSCFWNNLSCCGGRGTTNVYNTNNYAAPNSGNRDKEGGVLGPALAAFCVIFVAVASYFALAYAGYKIKNAKLENNKYAVPGAVALGTVTFSAFATLALLLGGVIVPNLEKATELEPGAFTAFQVILGINAVICALGAIGFFYLAASKVNQKATVDRAVDGFISDLNNKGQFSQRNGKEGVEGVGINGSSGGVPPKAGWNIPTHPSQYAGQQSNCNLSPEYPPPTYDQSQMSVNEACSSSLVQSQRVGNCVPSAPSLQLDSANSFVAYGHNLQV